MLVRTWNVRSLALRAPDLNPHAVNVQFRIIGGVRASYSSDWG